MLTDERLFKCAYQAVLDRAFAFQALGAVPARQAALAADATFTPARFAGLLAQATADQHLNQARPLLQDLFFYARKAYPSTPNASDLGPVGAQYLLLENAGDQKASLTVRVLPVGDE